jgi:hypothetical protein
MQKTLVIGIYLHGQYRLDSTGSIENDTIPNGMCVNIIHSASPGVPDISTLEVKEHISEKISEKIQTDRVHNELTKEEIYKLTEELRDLLVQENKVQSNDIINLHQYQYSCNEISPYLQQFSHHYDNAFKIASYKELDTIPNKIFTKFAEDELLNPDNTEIRYINKIVIYNLEGEPDLFELFSIVNRTFDTITLGQLLTFFSWFGVENLIIIDATCSVFKGDEKYLTDRNIRQLRRQMLHNFI